MPNSIPRGGVRKYCKVCFENKGERFWMDDLGDRIKCPNCGREVLVSGGKPLTRSLRSADPVRFRTRILRQIVGRFPQKPDFDIFHNQKSYQIIITLPYHKIEDVRCEIINGALIVESLIEGFDFLQKFSLPEDIMPSDFKFSLKNAILDICFEKKNEE